MPRLLQLPAEGGEVLIAIRTPEDLVQPTGVLEDAVERVGTSLGESLQIVTRIADTFNKVIVKSPIDTAELELGLECTGKGSIYVVESTGKAAIRVKLTFKPKG